MSILEARRTTPAEYEVLMQAQALANVDGRFQAAYGAWMATQAQATKQRGKKTVPHYERFDKFFDYEKEMDRAWRRIDEDGALAHDLAKRVQKANEKGG